jgi:hypothetical protein
MEEEILAVIGQPESQHLEYKAVLPPARSVAQLICSFANAEGGLIILGVSEKGGKIFINGLSEDFRANYVVHKAIDLITPKPTVDYESVFHHGKHLYAIKIHPSKEKASIEGKIFKRVDVSTILENPLAHAISSASYTGIVNLSSRIGSYRGTEAASKLRDHYLSVLNIAADLKTILYPLSPTQPTLNPEGKILMRILFSSCADNLETYLSNLLYEIFLANPNTLKSDETVTITEVLKCADLQEFVVYYAGKKLSKLKRGSVVGFISDNPQIGKLNAVTSTEEKEIEKILQIRHLYAHNNGIVDAKFLRFFPSGYRVNDVHEMPLDSMLQHLGYLFDIAHKIDLAAVNKFSLDIAP